MTYAQAVQEALRRDGASEEEIKQRMEFANLNVQVPSVHCELEPEQVEPIIAHLRELHAVVRKLSPLARSLLKHEMDERTRGFNKNN